MSTPINAGELTRDFDDAQNGLVNIVRGAERRDADVQTLFAVEPRFEIFQIDGLRRVIRRDILRQKNDDRNCVPVIRPLFGFESDGLQ